MDIKVGSMVCLKPLTRYALYSNTNLMASHVVCDLDPRDVGIIVGRCNGIFRSDYYEQLVHLLVGDQRGWVPERVLEEIK